MYLLMELSGCMLNVMNLFEHVYNIRILTYSIYGITRCIIYPYYIVDYLKEFYEPFWYHNIHSLFIFVIYIMSNVYIIMCIKKLIYNNYI